MEYRLRDMEVLFLQENAIRIHNYIELTYSCLIIMQIVMRMRLQKLICNNQLSAYFVYIAL